MKNIGKRTLSMLMATVMILSLVAVPAWNVQAEESDPICCMNMITASS